jgi:hypothetical protein
MRCLIDTKVLHAQTFYQTYLWEPSPAGDITIGPKDILASDSLDLETVLNEMKALGPKGELLVVAHSNQDGLMMDLIDGGKASAGFGVMTKILEISAGIRERKAIARLPSAQRPKAWLEWFKKFAKGYKLDAGFETGNPGWETTVEGWFDRWHAEQGRVVLKLPGGENDLDRFIQLVDDVRAAGFGRLEFRACDIGTKPDSLKGAAAFFNAKTVVAPTGVFTFFGSVSAIDILDEKKLAAKVKASPSARTFSGTKLALIVSPHGFRAFAPSEDDAKSFIKGYIRAGYKGPVRPFVTGGLQPVGKTVVPGKKYVFPLEKEYKSLLTKATL